MTEYKQLIIARKDLNMSPGKLAAQVAHASMAFLTNMIKEHASKRSYQSMNIHDPNIYWYYKSELYLNWQLYESWIEGSFTKIICEAKNKSKIEKAIKLAEELGLREGRDFFLIRDNCLTELEPEDCDGRTLTCIGFRPMPSDIVEKISKKFQLYR